jgi:acyl-CoA dehydrogenase
MCIFKILTFTQTSKFASDATTGRAVSAALHNPISEEIMPAYRAPVEDTLFVLNDVLKYERYNNLPGFADASPDIVEAVLREAGRMAEEVFFPLNQSGDQEGCTRHEDGSVTTPKGFKEAFEQYKEAGWMGLAFDPDYGGQGLPYTLHSAIGEYFSSANMAFAMYPA